MHDSYEMRVTVPSHIKVHNPLAYFHNALSFPQTDLTVENVHPTGSNFAGDQKFTVSYKLDFSGEPDNRFFQDVERAARNNHFTIEDMGHPGHTFRSFRMR